MINLKEKASTDQMKEQNNAKNNNAMVKWKKKDFVIVGVQFC